MGLIFKTVSSMEKVLYNTSDINALQKPYISGLKGETVSFQIAYYWEGPYKNIGYCETVSPVKDWVTVSSVGLVPCEYPCHIRRDDGYLATEPGLYPDLLKPVTDFGFPLVPRQWRSLWVEIEIPQNAQAGCFDVTVNLKSSSEQFGRVTVNIEVIDAVLPPLDIPHTEWFHADCLANYYDVEVFSEEHWHIVENFVKTAVKHHCNTLLTPVFTPPLDTAQGGERRTVQLVDVTVTDDNYSFGFEKFHRWVNMAQNCGIKYFEISHLFSQWGAVAAPKIMAMVNGEYKRIFGWETDAAGSEYAHFLHLFLTALKTELKNAHIDHCTIFHISDEPNMSQLESYRKALNAVKADLEGYDVIDALSDYEFYKSGLVKQPVCAVNHLEPFLAEGQRPDKLWTYYCTAQCEKVTNRFIVLPGTRTRILGTQLYKYRLDGFLQWGYNFYNCEYSLYPIDPYSCTDAGGAFPSGDAYLVYPAKDGTAAKSIRLKLMDEAMSDYCAMKKLEQLAGYDAVMECIEADGIITLTEYPDNASQLLALRERINNKIKSLLSK